MGKIGITTTIPVEVIFASGETPVDLNNIFITSPNPALLIKKAEEEGLPRNLCSWVKGIYAAILENPDVKTVIAVTEGDCTNTLAMLDVLSGSGVNVITFSYPFSRKSTHLNNAIGRLESDFGVSREKTEEWRLKLNVIRKKALRIDEMCWRENKVTGLTDHLALISCSDFEQDPHKFSQKLDNYIKEAEETEPMQHPIRLGYCGVPTIYSDLYGYLESMGARVVFNEMQRQFAMPYPAQSITEQYLNYTYPYSYSFRINDIQEEINKRKIDGIIHYVQSFCHHQIHDRSLKEKLSVPVLTLEGDKPGPLIERSKIRIESFLEMLALGRSGS